jgi:uncharacterized protein with PIN domain
MESPNLKKRTELESNERNNERKMTISGNQESPNSAIALTVKSGDTFAVITKYGKTRQDPANRRNCCKQCNGELEALSCEKLTEKYPTSPLIPEWKETINRKTL